MIKLKLALVSTLALLALVGVASAAPSLAVMNSAEACSRNCVETIAVKGGLVVVLKSSTGEVLLVRSVDLPADAVRVGTVTVTTTPITGSATRAANGAGGIAQMEATPMPGGGSLETSTITYVTPTTIVVVTTYTIRDSSGNVTDVQVVVTRIPRGMAK